MTKNMLSSAKLNKLAVALRNLPIFLLTGAVSLCVEVFGTGGIFASNPEIVNVAGVRIPLAWPEAIMSVSMTLIGLVLAGAAAAQKADPRKDERRRAGGTQVLAILVLIAPVFYAANALAMSHMREEQGAYLHSASYSADTATAADPMADHEDRAQARTNLIKAQRVTHADLEHLAPALLWIASLLGSNMLAVRLGWRAKPETAAQERSRLMAERTEKARRTRERNKHADGDNVTEFKRRA